MSNLTQPQLKLLLIIGLSLFFASCSVISPAPTATPSGPRETPTTIVQFNQTSTPPVLEANIEPVIKRTVEPIDLDAQLEAEIRAEVAEELEFAATEIIINIDGGTSTHEISPLIYGLPTGDRPYIIKTNAQLITWGGPSSTRYNWRLGNAWNLGKSGNYANTSFGYRGNDAALDFVQTGMDTEKQIYVTLPTLGWVAKDDNPFSCTFPANGRCSTGQAASCQSPNDLPDPSRTSVPSTPEEVLSFVEHLTTNGRELDFLAIAHEPESWGTTHYDVNPTCMSYEDILRVYLDHAVLLKQYTPNTELVGPSTCCWAFYWDSQVGTADKAKHNGADFLPWFLDQLREHDTELGQRHLDVLDIHFTRDFDNFGGGEALRLRDVNSLWDINYEEEGTIREAIYLIPRMKELIADHYPETKLGLGEWGFGNTQSLNGAMAIVDALGIFGREDVYYASHESALIEGTPGYYGFRLFTNYNDVGGRFGDLSLVTESSHHEQISAYAAKDSSTGNMHIILINKLGPFNSKDVTINIDGFVPDETIRQFDYSGPNFQGIDNGIDFELVEIEIDNNNSFTYSLAPSTIYHLILRPSES